MSIIWLSCFCLFKQRWLFSLIVTKEFLLSLSVYSFNLWRINISVILIYDQIPFHVRCFSIIAVDFKHLSFVIGKGLPHSFGKGIMKNNAI